MGPVDSIFYRYSNKDLFTFGLDAIGSSSYIKVWSLPDLNCVDTCHFTQSNICFWAVSPTLHYLACGMFDGDFKLFSFEGKNKKKIDSSGCSFVEISTISEHHDAAITSISFCEECNYFVTCAADTSIMFWDFEKRHLRTIVFNNPMRAALCVNKSGDCIISQSNYLLTVKLDAWCGNAKEDSVPILLNLAYFNFILICYHPNLPPVLAGLGVGRHNGYC